ncbi:MAG: hypothetical protein WC188_02220 [Candidatus Caldatribacteriota bacterium]
MTTTQTTTPTKKIEGFKALISLVDGINDAGENGQVPMLHFNRYLNLEEEKSRVETLNKVRAEMFGSEREEYILTRDLRDFEGRKTIEVVVNEDGTFFKRHEWSSWRGVAWNRAACEPLPPKEEYKATGRPAKPAKWRANNQPFNSKLAEGLRQLK